MKHVYQFCTIIVILVLTSCSETICDEGYEGENCETESRAKFIGSWIAHDWSCNSAAGGITVDFVLIAGPTVNDLIFVGLGSDIEFPATFSANQITIPLKQYGTTNLKGILFLNEAEQLELEFIIDNSITILECTATGMKI